MFGLLKIIRIIELRLNVFYFYSYLFFSHAIYSDSILSFFYSFQSLPHQTPIVPAPLLPFPYKKEQTSQGYQPNKSYQGAIRLGTNSYFKEKQGNVIEGKGS